MSDQPAAPPKPKVGSLRDRIAAFEKSASAAAPAPAPAPAPRPKPAGFANWKPKVPSPPSSPSAAATTTTDHASTSSARAGGMSATDAKESITKAGSLKDRMAALQGKGAFGAPPVVAAKPATEKPKWKPPPVVHAPVDDDDQPGEQTSIADAVERAMSPPTSVLSQKSIEAPKSNEGGEEAHRSDVLQAATAAGGDNEDETVAADPEEEERQRRAAIAARMARLGGTRVGMAPPVFGKKPPVRRPTQEEAPPAPDAAKSAEDLAKEGSSSPEITNPEDAKSSPVGAASTVSPPKETSPTGDSRTSAEYFPARKNSENASVLSAESAESQAAKTPTSMPVPAVPRRAGPPRRKPAKVAAPPPDVPEEQSEQPPVAEEIPIVAEQSIAESQTVEQSHEVEATVENEGLVEETTADLDTPKETTPAPIAPVTSSQPDMVVSEPEATPFQDASSTSSDITPAEEMSGIASPRPSIAVTETEDVISGGEDDDEKLPQQSLVAADVSSGPHHHPTPLAEPAVFQRLDEKLSTEASIQGDAERIQDNDEEDEDEQEARKQRIAERMAKMGGVNPFAPQGKKSVDEIPSSPPAEPVTSPIVSAPSAEKSFDTPTTAPPVGHATDAEPPAKSEEVDEDGSLYEDDDERSQYESHPPAVDENRGLVKAAQISQSPPSGIHPPVQVRQVAEANDDSEDSDYEEERQKQTLAQEVKQHTYERTVSDHHLAPEQHSSSPPARSAQPPRRIIPQAPEASEEEEEEEESDEEADERLAQSQLFIPPPSGQRSGGIVPPRRQPSQDEDGDGSENDTPALPILQRWSIEEPMRSASPPSDYDSEPDSDHDGQALPIPPRNVTVQPTLPTTLHAAQEEEEERPLHHSPPVRRAIPPVPTDDPAKTSPVMLAPMLHISKSEEVLDDEEGDPIDPGFHSPSRRTSTVNLQSIAQSQAQAIPSPTSTSHAVPTRTISSPPPSPPVAASPPVAEQAEDTEPDSEQLRRQTIAERMAKLGGIKFGAAPLPTPRPQPPAHHREEQEEAAPTDAQDEPASEVLSEEEEERARKERIASKMAQMGGMRIGMMPMGMGMGGLPTPRSHIHRADSDGPKSPTLPPPAPPTRAVPPSRPVQPPPPPPAADTDSEYGSTAASEDGVKVEAEESEPDEVDYAEVAVEEEAPPIPSRSARGPPHRQETSDKAASPPLPPSRPPVPTSMPPNRRSSVQTTRSMTGSSIGESAQNTVRKSSGFMPSNQSEYVMVEEPESQEAAPPPPPARPTSRVPPSRTTPQVPPPPSTRSTDPSDSISSQWELPNIPVSALDFGGDTDLSLSWTDAGAEQPAPTPPAPAAPAKKPAVHSTAELQLSADELMAMWGRVGVQVCEVATSMFEKSKKAFVGDGSYAGFVQAVLALVPNAAAAPTPAGEYGYLVYMQNGAAVQKRASEIMPGDIVEIHDAKLKGHKGLQTYHQSVGGAGEVLVGVVGEFEAKKTKIRVFHANQHVGQQTVESVSYRLEDLKSGLVKVYRVLEAY